MPFVGNIFTMIGSFSETARLTSYCMHKIMIQGVHVQIWSAKCDQAKSYPLSCLLQMTTRVSKYQGSSCIQGISISEVTSVLPVQVRSLL